jgi:hypothetical protein
MKTITMLAAALAALASAGGASAQEQPVYKCSGSSYSQAPCSSRIVRTYEAPVDLPQSRPRDIVAHRLPGETDQELALRKRRSHLSESDREECARLDKKIPFDQERLKAGSSQEDMEQAQDSLAQSRKRFSRLHC